MAKIVLGTALLVITVNTWVTVSCQLSECTTPRCSCCKNQVCEEDNDFCTEGCIDGIWGNRCYNPCRDNCVTCLQPFGIPCTSCIAGKYGSDCSNDCPANCATCTTDSTDGGYPCITSATNPLARCTTPRCGCCRDTVCRDNDDFCTNGCIYGIWGDKCYKPCPSNCATCTQTEVNGKPCTACVAGKFGSDCSNDCPAYCATCTQHGSDCTSCIAGKYGSDCSKDCPANCTTCTQHGSKCTSCIAGKYGADCSKDCPANCDTCTLDSRDGGYPCTTRKTGPLERCTSPTCSCCKDQLCQGSDNLCDSGCIDGIFGLRCFNPCLENCVTCSQLNGSPCMSCIAGKYGSDCSNDCTTNCATCTLDSTDGGYPCTSCIAGKYGSNCGYDCPTNCADCTLNSTDEGSTCTTCIAGYTGTKCDTCVDGYYRESYSDTNCVKCSSYCKTGICDELTGYCPNGCLDKYWGVACLNRCPGECLMCQRETGICEVCDHSKYKSDCSADCNAECQRNAQGQRLCKIQNGHCLTGCRTETLYGPLCQQLCSKNCINNECNWETGNCYECEENKYGLGCEIDCGNNCMHQGENQYSCYGTNGTCIHGCSNGYYGDKCDVECSPNCKTPRCSRNTGQCLDGCLSGHDESGTNCVNVLPHNDEVVSSPSGQGAVIGGSVGGGVAVIVLVVILVACVIKRRHRSNNRREDTSNTSGNQPTHTYYNTPNKDISGQSNSEAQPTPEYEELDEIPKLSHECDQVAIDTIETDNYDNLDRQQEETGQYDIIEATNKT